MAKRTNGISLTISEAKAWAVFVFVLGMTWGLQGATTAYLAKHQRNLEAKIDKLDDTIMGHLTIKIARAD